MHESLNSFPLLQKCTNNLKGPANTNQVPPLLLLLDNNGSLSSGKKPYLSTVYAYFPLSKLDWLLGQHWAQPLSWHYWR